MASSRTEIRTYALPGFDGAALAVHEMGEEDARPLLLLHGLFSNAETNWIKYGHAETIAAAGFRVIMPDLRAHGMSDAPHGADAYPDAVLVKDAQAVIAALALDDFDLGGFSLGARTTAALLAAGENRAGPYSPAWDSRGCADGQAAATSSSRRSTGVTR